MRAFLQNITGGHKASAKVVDGTLILSLPDALAPVVWRMELGHVRASAIEVRAQDDNVFMLTLKTPRGDVNDIAPYDSRAKAVSALIAVSRAMEHAHGQIPLAAPAHIANEGAAVASKAAPAPEKRGGQIVIAALGLVLVVGLLTVLMRMNPPMPGMDPSFDPALAGQAGAGPAQTGEAIAADAFLMNR